MKQQNNPFNTKLNARGKLRQTTVKMGKYLGTSGKQNIVIVFATIALFVIFTLINPSFSSEGMLLTMSKALVPYAILALGVTFSAAGAIKLGPVRLSGLAVGALVGIILNAVLPGNDYTFGANNQGDKSVNFKV